MLPWGFFFFSGWWQGHVSPTWPAAGLSGQNAPYQSLLCRSFTTGIRTRHGTCHLRVTRSGV